MIRREDTGLLVVDIQGRLAQIVHESEQMLANTDNLIKGVRLLQLPVLWLEQNPERLGPTTATLAEMLAPAAPITKYTFDACKEPSFVEAVRAAKVSTWLVCGVETHICVYQTVMHLKHLGYDVELVCDCVSSRTPFNKRLAMEKMAARGVGMTSVEMCLYELVVDCRAEEFRDILRIVK
ncbi:MAG: isochorismatase family protein [Desulfobulbus sp.]|nr:isochorismatase family protein [Desulfobulbus sp.]